MDDDEDQNLEEEEESTYPIGPKGRAYSVLRQVFCYCSVASFAYQLVVFGNVGSTDIVDKWPWYSRTSRFNIGGCVGYICCAIVIYTLGSKFAVVMSNILNLSIAAMAYIDYTSKQMDSISYTIYIIGFAQDFSEMSAYIYTAEVSDNMLRAFFVAFYNLTFYALLPQFNNTKEAKHLNLYRLGGVVLGVGSTILSVFVPQGPFWTAWKGNPEQARSTYAWLRAGDADDDECELMLEKAEISDGGEFASKLLSPTFAMCLAFCFILDFGFFGRCDLHFVVLHDLYIPKVDMTFRKLHKWFRTLHDAWKAHGYEYAFLGYLLYEVLCVVVPRKLLYLASVVFTTLLAAPIALRMDPDLLLKIVPLCEMAVCVGRFQSVFLIPIEVAFYSYFERTILHCDEKLIPKEVQSQFIPPECATIIYPVILRPLGVAISYIMYRILNILHSKMNVFTNFAGYSVNYPINKWVYGNFFLSLILVPFLLVYMPETKGMNLYELEEIKLPFAGASTQSDSAEETVEEE